MSTIEPEIEIANRCALTATPERALAAWEIASVITSTLLAEWAVPALVGVNKIVIAIPAACALALVIFSQRVHGETRRDVGWRFDNFWRALRLLLLPMLCGTILLALVGRWWFSTGLTLSRSRAGWSLLGFSVWGFVWGLSQQYVLQGFINRRAQLICGKGARSILLVAFAFALLHSPNLWLMGTTLFGGLLWAAVYQRAPNLFALALSHAFMTWALIATLPAEALQSLRVGYKFFG